MKRVRCPKCDNYIQFDETKYEEGHWFLYATIARSSLAFVSENLN